MGLVALPLNGHAPDNETVAAHLREHADWAADGAYGDVDSVLLLIESADGVIRRRVCGKPLDRARSCGLLSMAIARMATVLAHEEEP